MEDLKFDSLAQKLRPAVERLEQKRKELWKTGCTAGFWWGIVLFALMTGGMIFFEVEPVISLILGGIVGIIVFFFFLNSQSAVLSTYYKELIGEIVQNLCPAASYSPNDGISESVFSNSGLFTSPDRYHAEDQISGYVDKTSFVCSEVHAEERKTRTTKSGTQHYWVTIFRGFLFMADFHKDFKGKTTIIRNSLFKLKFGESRVKMESPEFEKVFDVFSTDQVEARYLITPSMMERLLSLNSRFGKDVTISFRNSTILVAIPSSRNCFEASVWRSLSDMRILKADFEVIHSLLEIVDELNLNTRIWTKE